MDLIDRQAVIRALVLAGTKEHNAKRGLLILSGIAVAIDIIEKVPAAEPKRKKGRWIIDPGIGCKCSECEFDIGNDLDFMECVNYCPNCGAYMGGDTDGDMPD